MTDLPAVSVDNLPSDSLLSEVLGNRDMGGGIAQTVRVPVQALANLLAPFGTHAVFATKADMDASLAYPANTGAEVWADSTSSNNGIYRKIGASGFGPWSKVADHASAALDARLDDFGNTLAASTLNIVDRPGEAIDFYTNVTPGLPEALTSLPSENVVAVSGRGRVYRATGTAVVAAKRVVRIEGARKYRVRAGVRRAADSGDPSGDAVVLAVQMLAADGSASGSPVALATLTDLTVASGARVVDVVVSTAAADDVNVVLPSGVYARVYWHAYGSTCQTDIEFISQPLDVTDSLAEAAARAAAVTAEAAARAAAITAEATARAAAVTAAVTAEATARAAAVTAEATARAAGDKSAIDALLLDIGRPGDRPDLFSLSVPGRPDDLTPLSSAGVVTVADGGRVYRLTGGAYVARRAMWRVEGGRRYRARGVLRRVTNVIGTPDDIVIFGVWPLDASGALIGDVVRLSQTSNLAVGQRITADAVVSTVAGDGVDAVLPSATVYVRPLWWINTTTCTNDVESVDDVVDVTDYGVLAPDVTGLSARVTAVESQQPSVVAQVTAAQAAAADALEQAQAANAAPSISYDTLPELQASTAPGGGAWPDGVVGYVLTGDDVGSYTKDASSPGGWRLLSKSTPQAVAARVDEIESQSYEDDEVPADALAFVFRTADGKVPLGFTQDGKAMFQPSDEVVETITGAEHRRLLLAVEPDENPITPLIQSEDDKRLLGVDEAGALVFQVSSQLQADLQRSPLANIQVTDRLPTATDGAAEGYEIGQSWILANRCHVCVQTTPTAVWAPARAHFTVAGNGYRDGRMPLPGDAINGEVPLVAAGFRRMRADYNGPCAVFSRDSDGSTLTLQYVGDYADTAALRAFIRGTKGRLETLYNHGSGADLTWAGDSRPVVSPAPMVGDSHGIIFENSVIYNGVVTPNQGVTIPPSITGSTDNVAVFWAGCFSHSQRSMPIIELSGSAPLGFGHHISATAKGLAVFANGGWKTSTYHPHIGAMVCGFSSSSAGLTIYGSDRNTTTLSAVTGTSWAGGVMGLITVGFFASNGITKYQDGTIMGGILIYGRATSADESVLIRRCLEAHFDMRPQIRGSLIVDGDSLEDGALGTAFESIARRTSRLTRRPVNTYLVARSGGTYQSQESAWADIKNIAYYNDPFCILNPVIGTNNISGLDASAAIIAGRLSSYLATVRQEPLTAVVLGNIRPREFGTDLEAIRQDYNQLLRDGWSTTYNVDALVDYAQIPPIGVDGAHLDEDLYPDGTHQSDLARGYDSDSRADTLDAVMTAKGLI